MPRFEDLDADQRAIMFADVTRGGTTLVSGPAGSGKTAIALYWCKGLADKGVPFILITYHPLLVDYMKSCFADLGIDRANCLSLNSWILSIYRKHINPNEEDIHSECIWRNRARDLRAFFESNPPLENARQNIVIDEVQDISEDQVHIIKALAHTVYATGDRAQAVTSQGGTQDLRRLWRPSRSYMLLRNYRTTKRVAELAALFLDEANSGMSRTDFVAETRGRPFEAQIEQFFVAGWINHIDMAARKARDARGDGRQVCIVLPTLERVKKALEAPQMRQLNPVLLSSHTGYQPNGGTYIAFVGSVKGLEFDHVVMPSLTASVWDDLKQWREPLVGTTLDRQVFVAMTRTRNWLTLIMDPVGPASFVSRIRNHLSSATGDAPAPF